MSSSRRRKGRQPFKGILPSRFHLIPDSHKRWWYLSPVTGCYTPHIRHILGPGWLPTFRVVFDERADCVMVGAFMVRSHQEVTHGS